MSQALKKPQELKPSYLWPKLSQRLLIELRARPFSICKASCLLCSRDPVSLPLVVVTVRSNMEASCPSPLLLLSKDAQKVLMLSQLRIRA